MPNVFLWTKTHLQLLVHKRSSMCQYWEAWLLQLSVNYERRNMLHLHLHTVDSPTPSLTSITSALCMFLYQRFLLRNTYSLKRSGTFWALVIVCRHISCQRCALLIPSWACTSPQMQKHTQSQATHHHKCAQTHPRKTQLDFVLHVLALVQSNADVQSAGECEHGNVTGLQLEIAAFHTLAQ